MRAFIRGFFLNMKFSQIRNDYTGIIEVMCAHSLIILLFSHYPVGLLLNHLLQPKSTPHQMLLAPYYIQFSI